MIICKVVFYGYNIKGQPGNQIFKLKIEAGVKEILQQADILDPNIDVGLVQVNNGIQHVEIVLQGAELGTEAQIAVSLKLKERIALFTSKFVGSQLTANKVEVYFNDENKNRQLKIWQNTNVAAPPKADADSDDSEFDFERLSKRYISVAPSYTFDQLVLPPNVMERLLETTNIISVEPKVFDTWGLRAIEPFARSVINFYGPPGTGKTMAAHAIAQKFGKNILVASYAQIESKYHGEGPKNVEAIFLAAQRDDALLFIDEADSMLSKRLTNVEHGSDQAINSMRSQLLICLEKFKGIVIFATNLVTNYDYAFETRVTNVRFELPDGENRKRIWKVHLVPKLPLGPDLDSDALAERFDGFCGRDIKNAVVRGAVAAALKDKECVGQEDLVRACEGIVSERELLGKAKDDTRRQPPTDRAKTGLTTILESTIRNSDNGVMQEIPEPPQPPI